MSFIKKVPPVLILLFCSIASASAVFPQNRGKAAATIGGKSIQVDYGRPALNGRDMLAQAAPGMIWRFGKDAATTIQIDGDMVVGSTKIPKGSYSLWAKKVSDTTWQLIFNKQIGQWGTNRDPKQDLIEIPLTVGPARESVELFTIEVIPAGGNRGSLKAAWGTRTLSTEFALQ